MSARCSACAARCRLSWRISPRCGSTGRTSTRTWVAIAEELNIGLDSLVFVDDNPAERALIEEMLPDVKVVRLPTRPCRLRRGAARPDGVREAQHHRRGSGKTRQYQEQRQRAGIRAVGDLDAFLASLQTEIRIRAPSAATRARVLQLFSKTNQFNVTTMRYSPADIDRFLPMTISCSGRSRLRTDLARWALSACI